MAESLVQDSYNTNGECRITLAEKTFWKRQQSITYPKNSPLTKPIDRQYLKFHNLFFINEIFISHDKYFLRLLLMHQAGFLDHALRKAKQFTNPCSIKQKKTTHESSGRKQEPDMLKLQDFQGAFLILGAGFSFAMLILACEFIYKTIAN